MVGPEQVEAEQSFLSQVQYIKYGRSGRGTSSWCRVIGAGAWLGYPRCTQ
ncbi:hypothetical protein GMOD_00005726 [Pyrenophora seminiperda CCB06]|uniref:Uncharacterized protein n=1 Tax=Pyrenophora seminiperda CCB06 TaxID=1302712 RepID=A0A3M7M9L6_9PLEO|nr:hypothetical protein GMOD_00005726 [Pyrenophora seminiperda CCB06]